MVVPVLGEILRLKPSDALRVLRIGDLGPMPLRNSGINFTDGVRDDTRFGPVSA